jgi:hypothetical protein
MTCNKYLVDNEKKLLLRNQNVYFDNEGKFLKDFHVVNHIEVDNNLYRISEGTILDQYVYMLAIVVYLQKERYLSFSKNDVLYFCCRENDLCRGSQALAQGFATSEFQLNRFFVRQYISLFKLNYDLFFSLYQYLLQDYHNDICCDYFLDDKINEICDDGILDQCYEDVPGSNFIMGESNGDKDRILVDGYDVALGYHCFLDNVAEWSSTDESCQLNVHSGFRNFRGDFKECKIIAAPWQDHNICYHALSSLFSYNKSCFEHLEIEINILVYDYKKNDFVINVEDEHGVCSVHPISFKSMKNVFRKIKINDFREKFIISICASPFLGSFQVRYVMSLFYYNVMFKMKDHVVDYYVIKTFHKYDHLYRDLPYDYKILYYDMLGENGISFCRPLFGTRSIIEQKRYFLSLYWFVCKDFFKGECYVCFQDKVKMVLLNCGHSVCYSCLYRIVHEYRSDCIKCPYCRRVFYFPDVVYQHYDDSPSDMYNCGVCLQGYSHISGGILKFPQFFLGGHTQFMDREYLDRVGDSDLWVCYQCHVAKDDMCDVCGTYKIYIFRDIQRLGFNGHRRVQCYSCHTNGRVRDVVEKED